MGKDDLRLFRIRTFSEVFEEFGRFLRVHGKSLLILLVRIPGPFILIASLMNAYFAPSTLPAGQLLSSPFLILLTLFASILASVLTLGTVVLYMKLIESSDSPPTISDLRKELFRSLAPLFKTFILWGLILFATLFVLILFFGAFQTLLVGGGSTGIYFGVFLAFLLFGLFLFILPLLTFLMVSSYYHALRERRGFIAAFGNGWWMLRTAFFRTWAVLFIGMLLLFALSTACSIPLLLFEWLHTYFTLDPLQVGFSSYLLLGLGSILNLLYLLVWAFLIVLVGIHYYSLQELRTGKGILTRHEWSFEA